MQISNHKQNERVQICSISIDNLSKSETLQNISDIVEKGEGGTVFTPNVDHLMLAEKNLAFQEAYQHSTINVADGMPLVWVSGLFGAKLKERVCGSDLLEPLLAIAGKKQWRVFLLGSTQPILRETKVLAKMLYPGIESIDYFAPDISIDPSEAQISLCAEYIRSYKPHIVFVALGAPKQEIFIDRIKDVFTKTVYLGIGASFDFFTGYVNRAPKWMRRLGLEWFYRLLCEPRRLFKRYIRDMFFPLVCLRHLLKR